MADRIQVEGEWIPAKRERSEAVPLNLFNPLMPWFDPGQWLQIEYQLTEIRLEGGEARIRSERKTFRDGVLTEETLNAVAGAELFEQAVEQMVQQTQAMMQAMLLPWAGLLEPLLGPVEAVGAASRRESK